MFLKNGKEIDWWLDYLGKPWKANPAPPESYNCGELVRFIYKDVLGIQSACIPVANARSALQCARAMKPEMFDLCPLDESQTPREFDVCFMGRRTLLGHCGIAVHTSDGLRILHCPEAACGVIISSPLELKYSGFPNIRWFRHKEFLCSKLNT